MRRYIFLLISIVVFFLATVPTIKSGRFTFAFDMGRDMLWTRNIVELKLPTLIGPWGSIAGIYFGPLWYYLLTIPYIITHGDPRGSVFVPLLSNFVTLVVGWFFLQRNKHPLAANIWAILYAISPLIISISSFPFHANLLPLVMMLFLVGIFQKNNWGLSLSALMVSLTYHFEPAAGFMITIFFIGWIVTYRFIFPNWRQILLALVAFSLPFFPQGVFEFRHNFVQTKALISYVKGENPSLGGVLPLTERISERVTKISGTLSQSMLPTDLVVGKWLLMGGFVLLLLKLLQKTRNDQFSQFICRFVLCFILFHYVAYVFIFPAELKGWYLYGFVSYFILSFSLILEKILRWNRALGVVLFATLVLFSGDLRRLVLFYHSNLGVASSDTVAAQLLAVDWVYRDALQDGRPFAIYTYTPPIYDYNYQYLIWWRGMRKFGTLPAEYSYVPGEASYVPQKERFNSQKWSPADAKIAYLIIEPDNIQKRVDGWLGNFTSFKSESVNTFESGLRVEKRSISR